MSKYSVCSPTVSSSSSHCNPFPTCSSTHNASAPSACTLNCTAVPLSSAVYGTTVLFATQSLSSTASPSAALADFNISTHANTNSNGGNSESSLSTISLTGKHSRAANAAPMPSSSQISSSRKSSVPASRRQHSTNFHDRWSERTQKR